MHKMVAEGCRVVGVHTWTGTFHRCRAANPRGQLFTIDECRAGQVINILSAELGYSVLYHTTTNPPQCPWRNCTVSTDVPARLCNGRRSCSIDQNILIYPMGSALCAVQKDGNFINVKFTCTASMNSVFIALHRFVFTVECARSNLVT